MGRSVSKGHEQEIHPGAEEPIERKRDQDADPVVNMAAAKPHADA